MTISHIEDVILSNADTLDKIKRNKITMEKAYMAIEASKEIRKNLNTHIKAETDNYLNHNIRFIKRRKKEKKEEPTVVNKMIVGKLTVAKKRKRA